MKVLLHEIWPISAPENYKLHFARWNKESQPLDVWVRDKGEWQGWQEYRPARNNFNRPNIFALIQFYHEPDIWLFGGIFRVLKRHPKRYAVELTDESSGFIGRLKLRSSYRERATRVNFENHYNELEVSEILREPYTGRVFSGFENIDLSFEELETLVRHSRSDWKAALASVKGVYLISDTKTGKRYVGSAYGDDGIWSRWCSYVATGHGNNVELRKLVSDPSLDYCRKAFRFALLESRPMATPDDVIVAREGFWKQILLSRGEHGLNRN
jgi:hypothetical protein